MPATCFRRVAGASRLRLAGELAPLSERWCATACVQTVRSDLYALVGYKCMHRRAARRLAPVFATALLEPSRLPSVLHAASTTRVQPQSSKQGDVQPRTRKLITLTQQISATKNPHRWRPSG